jgi:hypothetical protein
LKITRKGFYTIDRPDGTKLRRPDGKIRRVTSRDECYEYITEDIITFAEEQPENEPLPDLVTYTINCPEREVEVGLTDAGVVEDNNPLPVDQPPTISSAPEPTFTEGVAGTYDMKQHVSDDALSTVTYTLSNVLPNGLMFDEVTGILSYDGVAGSTVSVHQLTATDAVGSAQSTSFDITISSSQFSIFFNEPVEDNNFASRGWYDTTSQVLTSDGAIGGSTQSIDWTWTQGQNTPPGATAMRLSISPTDNIFIEYYQKVSSSWVGSGAGFHPHLIWFLTNKDSDFSGPFGSELTLYSEMNGPNGLTPRLAFANPANVNGVFYDSNNEDLQLDTWHKIQVFFKLNTMTGNVGNNDGVFKCWVDDQIVVNVQDAMVREGAANTDMQITQLGLAPYIEPGGGSPANQSVFIDEISLGLDVGIPDTTAPVLITPTGTETGHQSATGTVITDEPNGTLFYYASQSSTETLNSIIANGNFQGVTEIGTQTVNVSGLIPETTYYLHYVHRDNSGNDSNVVSSTAFTTDQAPVGNPAFYEETFDFAQSCAMGSYEGLPSCSGVDPNNDVGWEWDAGNNVNGSHTKVLAAANMSQGNGGMGLRFYKGAGANSQSGGPTWNFNGIRDEFWLRFYVRYESGFSWDFFNNDKQFFINTSSYQDGSSNTHVFVFQSDGLEFVKLGEAATGVFTGVDWFDIFGNTSDGLFHMFELHAKWHTGAGNDGEGRIWIDNVLQGQRTNINWGSGSGWRWMYGHHNQRNPSGGPWYVDIDDMAIYFDTPPNIDLQGNPYIGPVNGYNGG